MKKLLTGALAAVLSVSLCTPLVYAKDNVETKTLKKSNSGNPMLGFDENGDILYGGDPSVLVDGDTVYCYVGHDTSSNESYWMPDWRCYSSKDMKNWTYESKIMNSSDIKGGNNHEAWAGQVAKGSDGKYYFYYCTQFSDGKGVGVGVSDSPTGPFKDVNQKPLVSNSQTANSVHSWEDIDPTVWVETDENGVEHRYLGWGNTRFFVCELNEDMISIKDQDGNPDNLSVGYGKGNDIVIGKINNLQGHTYTEAPWYYRQKDENGNYKFYGRFNQGVVTINLPDVALSSGGDFKKFWEIFDERLDLCYRALMLRHKRLEGTLSDAAPILWQYGALARLKKGETIDKLLYGGYSTISLGYAGLYECVKYMTGKSHTDPEATPFALEVMQHMNDACNKWKRETNIAFSIYGSPIESTTYKFAKCLQKRFGIIEGITDKNYITNSYHVHVTEPIDAFSKLKFESQFQALSTGGAISYVEVPDMQDNIPAVIQVMRFIYDNIMYAELNTKSDYCQECGYTGEIQIVEDEHKKLIWKCPKCGCTDQNKLNVARRTCGYIGTQFWNQGRTQEIKERVLHL